jgi:hypothetical protein
MSGKEKSPVSVCLVSFETGLLIHNKEMPPLAHIQYYHRNPSPSNTFASGHLQEENTVDDYISTTDLYEGAYYLTHSCELVSIDGKRLNGKVACELTFTKPGITRLQIDYFKGSAEVNLLSFRRAFGQVHAWVYHEKKRFQNILKNGGTLEAKGGAV